MASYHVYFSPKEGISHEVLVKQVHEFMATQVHENHAESYRILRMNNKASFENLPDYHLIVDYPSEEGLQKGFNGMKKHYRGEPHSLLMKMVSDFRVAFSVDEKPISEQFVDDNPS
ncbi:MAG: DUF6614 family protein [Verrucomicrobiota bacterium]